MINPRLLRGEKVRLTAISKDDAAVMARWNEDAEYMQLVDTGAMRLWNAEQTAAHLEKRAGDDTLISFGIRTIEDNRLIGTVDLAMIEWTNGCAWVGMGIGEREYWNQGYGSEALHLLIEYAFEELNMHRLSLCVIDYNERAIAVYEKAGFKREGTFREFGLRAGKRYDMYLYGLLRPEWLALRGRA